MLDLVLVVASLLLFVALAGVVYPFKPFGKRRNALFTFIGCLVLVVGATPSVETPVKEQNTTVAKAVPTNGELLPVPSDPKARYFVTGIERRTDGLIEVSTRREGPSGTSFAIRLVQCEPLRFGYIADADTEAELVREPSPELSVLVDGSISDVIAKHACSIQDKRPVLEVKQEPAEIKADLDAAKRAKMEEDVRKAVEILLWTDARNRYRTLSNSGLLTEEFKDEIEVRMLELVRPLPAQERETNLNGYLFLAAVRPDNPEYAAKIDTYEEAIKAARSRAIAILRKKEDRVEGITWYQHPNQPKYLNSRSTAYLYIGKKGGAGRPWLRLKVQYTSSDWLFVSRVIAWHDGIKEPLVAGNFKRDNNSTIWEWMDVSPDEYQVEVLRSLGNAREAILRFEGNQYHRDVVLSAGDKKAIREVLEAYEVMRSGM